MKMNSKKILTIYTSELIDDKTYFTYNNDENKLIKDISMDVYNDDRLDWLIRRDNKIIDEIYYDEIKLTNYYYEDGIYISPEIKNSKGVAVLGFGVVFYNYTGTNNLISLKDDGLKKELKKINSIKLTKEEIKEIERNKKMKLKIKNKNLLMII